MKGKISKSIIAEYNKTRSYFKRAKLCYAPFNSLRFSLSGNIYACCYNRFHSLGKYPEVSIREAWTGEKANELRQFISENNLSSGCHACYAKLISKNYFATGARIYDAYKIKSQGPSLMEFEITSKCNLECIMCNGENSSLIRKNRENGDPYPMVYDDNFVKQFTEFIPYLKEARFVGGEPFMEDIYYKMWEMISGNGKNTLISILTNGTILNERIISFYKNNNVNISFSIDSVNKDTYQAIRINADYEKVSDNFKKILEISKQYKRGINVNVCPLRINMWEIPEILNYYTNLDVPVVIHTVVYPPALAVGTLPEKDLNEYLNYLKKQKITENKRFSNHNSVTFVSYIKQVNEWAKMMKGFEEVEKNSSDNLLMKLSDRIMKYSGSNISEADRCIGVINQVLMLIDDKETRSRALLSLMKIDPGYIISETETSSVQMLKERLLNIAM